MNVEFRFLQKAIADKNYISFSYENQNYKNVKPLKLDSENRRIKLNLTIDTNLCPVLDYFEIFMDRTMMSKFAAKYLGIWFELVINDTKLL